MGTEGSLLWCLISLSLNSQKKVENVSYPVLVDFFATWCGPCKMMAPVLDRVALAKQGKAAVYKVDVDQSLSLPSVLA